MTNDVTLEAALFTLLVFGTVLLGVAGIVEWGSVLWQTFKRWYRGKVYPSDALRDDWEGRMRP